MSYLILYDRQFIRSTQGLTPAVMMGDNNVWTGGRYQRRARDWSVIGNRLALSEEQLLALAESWTCGLYQEHWKQGGKWVDDAGLLRWMKNGIKNAATIEEIISVNRFRSVECLLSVWAERKHKTELNVYVKSNEEFDSWVEQAGLRIAELKNGQGNGNCVYPIIRFTSEFSDDKMQHPKVMSTVNSPETVILKRGCNYLTEIVKDESKNVNSTSWERNVKNALEMSYNEAVLLMREFRGWSLGAAQIVDASVKQLPYNAVIRMIDAQNRYGSYDGYFIRNITATRVTFSHAEDGAKHYRDKKAAEKALKRLLPKLQGKNYGAEVVVLEA
ncbi:MAG: hypothetical protein RR415_13405 [Ruthenibacterium sp.]